MPNPVTAADSLLYTTVRIECDTSNGTSIGTGFFFLLAPDAENWIPTIVTNKHVVKDAKNGYFQLHRTDGTGSQRFDIPEFERLWIQYPEPEVDLCAMPIAPILTSATKRGMQLFFKGFSRDTIPTLQELDDLLPIEDILMVGYPTGLWDSANNLPIVRRGITATHAKTDYCGEKKFLIDAACFQGSSGSPVLLYNTGPYLVRSGDTIAGAPRVKLLGILHAAPRQHEVTGEIVFAHIPAKPIVLSKIPNNLGLAITSQRLLDFQYLLGDFNKASKELASLLPEDAPIDPTLGFTSITT